DASGLVIPPGEPVPTLRIVIADDNGGSIFATLEHGAPERADSFERVFATPPGVDIADVAKGYGVPVTEVDDDDSLTAALARDWAGVEVIVVRFSRKNRRARAQDLAARSERAIRGL
ncbi:MAG TPA: 2-succinyl-5-enolpyruvyl-6-hydroxy-3-cyclohexene-1-carboxylic-acid synthase, partial [Propionibacteriaceae bacterium]|nr:2-succinyl-5-enolpyruvyl-6-hydroxy-3-cyclohexene-1-carboxylic-acid synthase [Propionibacteriaceae bacterium]